MTQLSGRRSRMYSPLASSEQLPLLALPIGLGATATRLLLRFLAPALRRKRHRRLLHSQSRLRPSDGREGF